MGVIAQYQVSPAFPSTVGGTGTAKKYFSSMPPQSLWNSGVTGVNTPQASSQLGATPSASGGSALGQLSFDSVANKIVGGRFRMYASGTVLSVTGTPTFTPTVEINTGTIAVSSYATLLGGVASAALTANKSVGWSVAGDLYFDPIAGSLAGWMKYSYAATTAGTPLALEAAENVTAVSVPTGMASGGLYASQFGFVVSVSFGTSVADNTASLYEFKIVQD